MGCGGLLFLWIRLGEASISLGWIEILLEFSLFFEVMLKSLGLDCELGVFVSRIESEIMSASQKHNFVGDELSTLVWSSYYLMYTTYNFLLHIYVVFRILWIAYHADIWVYPILKVLDNQYRLGFFAACWLCLALMYLLGDLLNNTFWSKYFTEWIPQF